MRHPAPRSNRSSPTLALLRSAERLLHPVPAAGAAVHGVLLYPERYQIGMSNLAVHTLLRALNQDGIACERAFLPAEADLAALSAPRRPLTSFETGTPLAQFDFVAITCPFELDYLNIPLLLQLGGIAPLAADRPPGAPLVLLGGPAPTANPEPPAPFVDAIAIGELEPIAAELREVLAGLAAPLPDKAAALAQLAALPGMYVPALAGQGSAQPPVRRLYAPRLDQFDTASLILTPHTEFASRFLVEVGRGCGRGCRFCMAQAVYHPVRVRRPEQIMAAFEPARPHTDLIGLVGAALSDYPWIDELCLRLREAGASISVSSVRAESVTPTLLQSLAESGQRTVTYAPEAGDAELRASVGKAMTDAQLLAAIGLAAAAGLSEVKLYFMLGLPGETLDHVDSIGRLLGGLVTAFPSLRFTLSASPFVPKPHTPLEMESMPAVSELRRRAARLGSLVRRLPRVRARFGSPRWAVAQAALSRGGRELSEPLLRASLGDRSLQALEAAMAQAGLELDSYRSPVPSGATEPPWKVVDMACRGR
jgi:radical SAM superfamily enzyme YgiQ (UPF0313 family)